MTGQEEIQHYSSALANISNALNLSIWENEKYFNLTVDESSTSQILSRKDLEHVVKACKLVLNKQTKRFLFIYVDGEYKLIEYIEAETQEKAEEKADEGWTRIVELESDMQIVYNGV